MRKTVTLRPRHMIVLLALVTMAAACGGSATGSGSGTAPPASPTSAAPAGDGGP